jgi:hypothetical protein
MGLTIILRAIAVSGLMICLNQHIEMAWWEGGLMSFSVMILIGSIADV